MRKTVQMILGLLLGVILLVAAPSDTAWAALDGYYGTGDMEYAEIGLDGSNNPTYTLTTTDGETISTDSSGYDATVLIMGNLLCPVTQSTVRSVASSDWVNASNVRVIFAVDREYTDEKVAAFKETYACDAFYCCCYDANVTGRMFSAYWNKTVSQSTVLPLVVLIDGNNTVQSVTMFGRTQNEILSRILRFTDVQIGDTTITNETVDIQVKGTEDYSAAQEMLALLNEQRSSLGLRELVLDEELTKYAMQRAAEISLFYHHTRPDGSMFYTISGSALGENFAGLLDDPADVMQAWQPDSYNTTGANYKNITSSSAKSVGIGCFIDENGNYFWVQYYGSGEGDALTETGTREVTRTVSILPHSLSLTASVESGDYGYYGTQYTLDLDISNTNSEWSTIVTKLADSSFTYTSSDASVASVDADGVITVKGEGTVTITAVLKADTSISFSCDLNITSEGGSSVSKTVSVTLSGTENYSYAQEVAELVNETRTALGLSELMLDEELTEAAMQRAAEIALYYSHTRPDGTSCSTIDTSGSTWAENIACGQDTPAEVMNDWLNSSGHYANITNSSMTRIGIGCFTDSNGRLYWVQFFDNASGAALTQTGTVAVTRTVKILTDNIDLQTDASLTAEYGSSNTSVSMEVRQTNPYSWYDRPALDASNFNYYSSDTSIASVDASGKVTLHAIGSATITAALKDDPTCYVQTVATMEKASQSVTLSDYYCYLYVDEQFQITASGVGSLSYSSSDTSVASVNASGKITAKGVGNTTITVTAAGNDAYAAASTTVRVYVIRQSQSIMTSTSGTVYVGRTMQITTTTNGDADVTYTSSDTSVATVDANGLVTGVSAGYVTITVTAEETSAYYGATSRLTFYVWEFTQTDISSQYDMELSSYSYTYDGKAKKPTVTVTEWWDDTPLVNGTDYTVSYSNNTKIGTATVTVTGKGDYKGTLKATFEIKPATPAISKVANTTGGIKITWKKVTGASGYYIYRSTSKNGTYTKIGTVTSGSTVTYTNKTSGTNQITANTTYYYKVVAYTSASSSASSASSTVSGSKSAASSAIKYLVAKVSGLTNTSSGITVKWSKVSGASGYYVYRKAGSGSYSKIKTITSVSTVSYTDTAVKSKNGTTYTYYVMPYYKSGTSKIAGTYSATKKIVRLTATKFTTAKNISSKKLSLKWAKNSSSTGYEIQYSTSKSFASASTTKKTITGKSTTSKTYTGLKKGKTYYVRIRVYKKVGSTKYYSAWSTVKTVKISK